MLLEGKGWIVREFYNEYLELKSEIQGLTNDIEFLKLRGHEDSTKELEEILEELLPKFKFTVEQLNLKGVKTLDLLLLSMGIDVN